MPRPPKHMQIVRNKLTTGGTLVAAREPLGTEGATDVKSTDILAPEYFSENWALDSHLSLTFLQMEFMCEHRADVPRAANSYIEQAQSGLANKQVRCFQSQLSSNATTGKYISLVKALYINEVKHLFV